MPDYIVEPGDVIPSKAQKLAATGESDAFLSTLTWAQQKALRHDSSFICRPDQQLRQAAGYYCLFLRSGRGAGKTCAGVFALIDWIKAGFKKILIITAIADDLETTIRDEIEKHFPMEWIEKWTSKPFEITIKEEFGGAIIRGRTGEKPERLRGKSVDAILVDEWTSHEKRREVLDQCDFLLREIPERDSDLPPFLITSTPKYFSVVKELIARPDTYTISVPSMANEMNVTRRYIETNVNRHKGTLWYDQEVLGLMVNLAGTSLFTPGVMKDYAQFWGTDRHGEDPYCRDIAAFDDPASRALFRDGIGEIVVNVDPAGYMGQKLETKEVGDTIGITCCGRINMTSPEEYVVLEDWSFKGDVHEWTNRAMDLAERWQASTIIIEGGNVQKGFAPMLNASTRKRKWAVKVVAPGADPKHVRAQPLSALYSQGRVWHARRHHEKRMHSLQLLEDEMCDFSASDFLGDFSPDRTDSLVYGIRHLAGIDKVKMTGSVLMSEKARQQVLAMGQRVP